MNTDSQALRQSKAKRKVLLGAGLGAGSIPEEGRKAALDSVEEISKQIKDTQMLFITAGMGGGTGTGAAPVIAENALKQGILTVAFVTTPFHFEGEKRMQIARAGIKKLETCNHFFFHLSQFLVKTADVGDRCGHVDRNTKSEAGCGGSVAACERIFQRSE